MWKINPKDKCICKYKHDQIYTDIQNMFLIMVFEETRRRRERKRE
jgi:hypothetical protein